MSALSNPTTSEPVTATETLDCRAGGLWRRIMFGNDVGASPGDRPTVLMRGRCAEQLVEANAVSKLQAELALLVREQFGYVAVLVGDGAASKPNGAHKAPL